MAEAWFCPACQKYHAPHVETCPAGAQPGSAPASPGIAPWGVPYTPYPRSAALVPYDPCAACDRAGACGNAACPKRTICWNETTILAGAH